MPCFLFYQERLFLFFPLWLSLVAFSQSINSSIDSCVNTKIYPSKILVTVFSSYFSEFYSCLQISYYTIISLDLYNLHLHCEHNHDRAITTTTSNCLPLQVSRYTVSIIQGWRDRTEFSLKQYMLFHLLDIFSVITSEK